MQIKIGDTIYDSEKTPIMLIVNDEEKELIANMTMNKFCSFPHGLDTKEIEIFMRD